MTIFDYLVLFILIASVVISMLRGLMKEILSLVSWIVAFVVANMFGADLAPLRYVTVTRNAGHVLI